MAAERLPEDAYRHLLALRTGLRLFEHWSAQQAEAAGLTPAQHQLLLAIRGHPHPDGPTIGEVADSLLLRHHSAVGLIDRAEAAGLVQRTRDGEDRRIVRLQLTKEGRERLEALSALHLEELERLQLKLPAAWRDLEPFQRTRAFASRTAPPAQPTPPVRIARVTDRPKPDGRPRVLVDRLWPRGLRKDEAPFDRWAKELAPSSELRRWYGHVPERFEEFSRRYRAELTREPASSALESLRHEPGGVTLVTATRDVEHSGAEVLRLALTST